MRNQEMAQELKVCSVKAKLIEETRREQRKARVRLLRVERLQQVRELEGSRQYQDKVFQNLIGDLLSLNPPYPLASALLYSQQLNYSHRLLQFVPLFITHLQNQNPFDRETALRILSNLSLLDNYQLPEDTYSIQLLLNHIPTHPQLVFSILSSHLNREQYCPNIIFHIIGSPALQQIQQHILKKQVGGRVETCRFLCAVGRSKEGVGEETLEWVNQMIADTLELGRQPGVVEEVALYLSEFSSVGQNQKLAHSLYFKFSNIFQYLIESKLDQSLIIHFLSYLSHHKSLLTDLGSNKTIIDILYTLIFDSNNKKTSLQILHRIITYQNTLSFQIIPQKLFDHLLSTFNKMKYPEQLLALDIVFEYVTDMLEENGEMLSYEIQKLIKECLQSEYLQFIQKGMDMVVRVTFITDNFELARKLQPVLETMLTLQGLQGPTCQSVQEILTRLQHNNL